MTKQYQIKYNLQVAIMNYVKSEECTNTSEDKMSRPNDRELAAEKAFSPDAPIKDEEHLKGRKDELKRLKAMLRSTGSQAILFGDRGVGKTSIAKVFMNHAESEGCEVIQIQCSGTDTFSSITESILEKAGLDLQIDSINESHELNAEIGAEGEVGVPIVAKGKAGGKAGITQSKEVSSSIRRNFDSPQWFAEALPQNTRNSLRYLIVLDEYDRIKNHSVHEKIADTLKLFSDNFSKYKMLVVGVAKTPEDLLAAHGSLPRALAEIPLDKMSDTSLAEIISSGMTEIGCTIDDDVQQLIVQKSNGQPHYTHLMCLHSAKQAISEGGNYNITLRIFRNALTDCANDAKSCLQAELNKLRSRKHYHQYLLVMYAASRCDSSGFSINSVQAQAESLLSGKNTFSKDKGYYARRFSKCVCDREIIAKSLQCLAKKNILTRPNNNRAGVYMFADPRMASHVSMLVDSKDFSLAPL